MVPERLSYGASWLLDRYDKGTRRLVFIMCLPLVDGVFATLLVSGAVDTFSSMISVALTVFAGAGALAVLYSESETPSDARRMVLKALPPVVLGSLLVSLVAPVYAQLVNLESIRLAAGVALSAIGLQMLEVRYAERFSVPGILVTGLVLSVRAPSSISFSFEYVVPALTTSLVAASALYILSEAVSWADIGYVRRAGGFVLLTIAASLFGLGIPSELGLTVFALAFMFSMR